MFLLSQDSSPTKHQADLFQETAPSDPLIGRTVTLDKPCDKCGTTAAIIEPGRGPHVGELRCRNCNKHRQWMSRETYTAFAKFVAEIAATFGAPEAINFRSLSTGRATAAVHKVEASTSGEKPAPDGVPFNDPIGF